MGIADGTSETTFSPDMPVTRGEFAKMLYRALSIP
ncbi:MAG: S-layer homology domain-containing protein [Anaerolineales bacterium]|nr:S-layer homology domain-containing protein [Anaerolineales bacterium]